MSENMILPRLGISMVDATIVEWKVKEGEMVHVGQPLVLIETEKVSYELPSVFDGILHIIVLADRTVPVGEVLAVIAASQDEYLKIQAGGAPASVEEQASIEEPATSERETVKPEPEQKREQERVRISPLIRKLAKERGVDLSKVVGSGPEGRILKEDVLVALDETKETRQTALPSAVEEATPFKKVKEVIPLKGMRKVIAERMLQSLQTAAQLTRWTDVDMSEMIKLRQALLSREDMVKVRITYADIFVMVTAQALKLHPLLNSSVVGDEIKVWENINIGVAVAIENDSTGGLIVPVLRNADKLSLSEIHHTLATLAAKARDGKLLPDDIAGGTFTITNQGALLQSCTDFDTPIINQPEVAILGTYAIVDQPVVREGEIVVRPIMKCGLTHDHRAVDGIPAGRFMATIRTLMEDPHWLLER